MSDKKNNLQGLLKFHNLLFNEIKNDALSKIDNDRFEEVISYRMFGLDVPAPKVAKKKFNQKEEMLSLVFYEMYEITTTYSIMEDIELYIRRFPFSNTRIDRVNYLRYHIGNYYSEIYNLQERLLKFCKRLKRFYKNSYRHGSIEKRTDILGEFVLSSFKSVVKIRHQHVHLNRFTDKPLDKIDDINLYSKLDDNKLSLVLGNLFKYEFQNTRKEWAKTINNNNINIMKILNTYFGVLEKIIFNKNGKILYY